MGRCSDCFEEDLRGAVAIRGLQLGRSAHLSARAIHASMHIKWIFRLSALPNRWIRDTAPVWAALQEKPAFLIRCVVMQRYTIPST